jgi:protein-disulfide isomerase
MKSEAGGGPRLSLTLPVAGRDHLHGPADAAATLLEYGDYECPYCGAAHPVVKAVQKRLGDRLLFAFRNFPLSNSHPHAEHAAEAAEAAAAQGRFWEMHDLLFENQEALEDQDLAGYADSLKLDSARLIGEVSGGAYSLRIREDFRMGARGGVNGTPTFFVNGVHYGGMPSVEGLLAALSEGR